MELDSLCILLLLLAFYDSTVRTYCTVYIHFKLATINLSFFIKGISIISAYYLVLTCSFFVSGAGSPVCGFLRPGGEGGGPGEADRACPQPPPPHLPEHRQRR